MLHGSEKVLLRFQKVLHGTQNALDGTASPKEACSWLGLSSGRAGVSFRVGGHEAARRTINERRPPCRHSVRG